jgi:hypothetical protein
LYFEKLEPRFLLSAVSLPAEVADDPVSHMTDHVIQHHEIIASKLDSVLDIFTSLNTAKLRIPI